MDIIIIIIITNDSDDSRTFLIVQPDAPTVTAAGVPEQRTVSPNNGNSSNNNNPDILNITTTGLQLDPGVQGKAAGTAAKPMRGSDLPDQHQQNDQLKKQGEKLAKDLQETTKTDAQGSTPGGTTGK